MSPDKWRFLHMNKKILLLIAVVFMTFLVACNDNAGDETDELKALEVDFETPEKVEVDEVVELKATVTYGEDVVLDADEVVFEYWLHGNEEDSVKVNANNNEDGTYTAEVSFDADGIYEIYAHTTARDLHTMPKNSIIVGDGENHEPDNGTEDEHSHHTEGFQLHFMEPEQIEVNAETEFTVHLMLAENPLEAARVRYEIKNDAQETQDWVETEEVAPGEYTSTYSFAEVGNYQIVIHVENDEGLHEHTEQEIEVK